MLLALFRRSIFGAVAEYRKLKYGHPSFHNRFHITPYRQLYSALSDAYCFSLASLRADKPTIHRGASSSSSKRPQSPLCTWTSPTIYVKPTGVPHVDASFLVLILILSIITLDFTADSETIGSEPGTCRRYYSRDQTLKRRSKTTSTHNECMIRTTKLMSNSFHKRVVNLVLSLFGLIILRLRDPFEPHGRISSSFARAFIATGILGLTADFLWDSTAEHRLVQKGVDTWKAVFVRVAKCDHDHGSRLAEDVIFSHFLPFVSRWAIESPSSESIDCGLQFIHSFLTSSDADDVVSRCQLAYHANTSFFERPCRSSLSPRKSGDSMGRT